MERWTRIGIIVLVLGAAAIPIVGRWLAQPAEAITIRGRMAEHGGWTQDYLSAKVGEPLQLRMTSDDVVHGFAVGHHESPEVEVLPGEWTTTSLTFDRPGTYTFYCTRWCGSGHWRMRGTIEIGGEAADGEPINTEATAISPPRYVRYGIDLDAPERAEVIPDTTPSAQRGAQWQSQLPAYALEATTYWRHSPVALWAQLREEQALRELSDMDLWDAVAWIWAQQTTPKALAEAEKIYQREGAAAHGETGRGDGVMVQDLPAYTYEFKANGHEAIQPPNFADPGHTLGASPARLEGKMLRGGMGTGMPSYGEIYTRQEIEALVAYIYTFVMDLDLQAGTSLH